jgi:hypothetical protein
MNKIIFRTTNQVKDARTLGGGEIRPLGDHSFYSPETRALRTKFEKEIDA